MNERSRTSRTLLSFLVAAGCTSSSTADNPVGSSGTGGAAGGGNDGGRSSGDASSSAEGGLRCDTKPDAAAGGRSSEGVLTNLPALRFSKTGGQLYITSANFDLKKFPGFNSLAIWGDVQNRTSVQQCIPVADVFQMQTEDGGVTGGTVDVGIVIEGPAYELPGSVFTIVCFDPCGSGVFSGVLNTAADDLLDTTTNVAYSFSALVTSPKNLRHPDDPAIVSAATKQVAGGFALGGTMKAGSRDINLLVVNVFVRNATGLVYNEVQARPGNLGTIAAATQFDFETEANTEFFTGYELFDKFAVGPAP